MNSEKPLQHQNWLKTAKRSSDSRTRELFRIHERAGLKDDQWLFVWWISTQTMKDPDYRMTGKEIHFRVIRRVAGEELSRVLAPAWEGQTLLAREESAARRLVLCVRAILEKFYEGDGQRPNGVEITMPKHWQDTQGQEVTAAQEGYRLCFVFADEKSSSAKPKSPDALSPAEKIWERLLAPIGSARGSLIYSNEQPELGETINALGEYSGTGEVAAALMIGLRTAHLGCEIVPYRSRKFISPLFKEKPAWFVYLGSPASNCAMQMVRAEPKWRRLQKFTFEEPKQIGQPWALKRNDESWRREIEPAGHDPKQEYALITYLHKDHQVIIALSGMTTVGTYAAANFFTDDDCIEKLLAHLDIGPNDTIPSFEVVLRFAVFEGGDDGEASIVNSDKTPG